MDIYRNLSAERDRKIIMICFIALVLIVATHFIIQDSHDPLTNLNCHSTSTINTNVTLPKSNNRFVFNNIQASHSYNDKFYSYQNLTCVKSDDMGVLFGSSMQPSFFEDNTVLTKNFTENMTLKGGDIVRFYRFTKLIPNCSVLRDVLSNGSVQNAILHRVNAIYPDYILVQADNLNEQEQISRCQITNVAIGVIFT